MTAWLDENCGIDGWAMTPSGTRGVLNDAASIYFLDATLAGAFVARWCAGYRVETAGGVFQVRDYDLQHRGSGRRRIGCREATFGVDAPCAPTSSVGLARGTSTPCPYAPASASTMPEPVRTTRVGI
ncbi:MAG TPA: hypothetical protein VH157_13055 [Bryobacteraceae bacterium]|nr:hypothetical protein [Bryobacteraceae bacterium]